MSAERHAIRLGVVGSRTFRDREILYWYLDKYATDYDLQLIVSGGAMGADSFAEQWADEHGVKKRILMPDYTFHGRAAPFVRNAEIVDNCDRLLAFFPGTTSTPGTAHTVMLARRKGVPVEEVHVTDALRDAFTPKDASGSTNGGPDGTEVTEGSESPS